MGWLRSPARRRLVPDAGPEGGAGGKPTSCRGLVARLRHGVVSFLERPSYWTHTGGFGQLVLAGSPVARPRVRLRTGRPRPRRSLWHRRTSCRLLRRWRPSCGSSAWRREPPSSSRPRRRGPPWPCRLSRRAAATPRTPPSGPLRVPGGIARSSCDPASGWPRPPGGRRRRGRRARSGGSCAPPGSRRKTSRATIVLGSWAGAPQPSWRYFA